MNHRVKTPSNIESKSRSSKSDTKGDIQTQNPKIEIRNEIVLELVLSDDFDLFRISAFEFLSFVVLGGLCVLCARYSDF